MTKGLEVCEPRFVSYRGWPSGVLDARTKFNDFWRRTQGQSAGARSVRAPKVKVKTGARRVWRPKNRLAKS